MQMGLTDDEIAKLAAEGKLEDFEVLGIRDGHVIQWDATGDTTGTPGAYDCGETLEEFGIHNLNNIERLRCGLRCDFSSD